MQALPAQPESLCIVEMGGTEKQDELGERGSIGFLYLNIGLQVRLSLHCWCPAYFSFHALCSVWSFSVPVLSGNHLMKSELLLSVPLPSGLIRTDQA